MRNKKLDFKHKLGAFYTSEYDAVFVEDLDVRPMLDGERNSRNVHEVGWRDFIEMLTQHGKKRGCHVVAVDPRDTTNEWAQCRVKPAKLLWVREHSCPSCGFEADRGVNTAVNVWERGVGKLGVDHSERTPVETGTAVDTEASATAVSARTVVEAGSSGLTKTARAAE